MRTRRFLSTLILASLAVTSSALMAPSALLAADPSQPSPPASAEGVDKLVLNNGKVVEGKILSETDSEVEILVMYKGIKAATKYKKSDILDIQRTSKAAPAPAPTPGIAPAPVEKTVESAKTKDKEPSNSPSGPKLYLMKLKGDFGWDISKSSLQRAFDDALANNPDAIVVRMDCGTKRKGFDGLWTSEDLGPIVEKVIADGHRVVFWIERTSSGAAFLPFISPEIYFTTEGKLGGVGDLSDFNIGDKLVNEKQISLRLGHAEGFAVKGGYNPLLIRAMARREMWLFWRPEGGSPVYLDHEPRPEDGEGWILLSDDGQAQNKDEFSFEGNDVLNFDAKLAYDLKVSKGSADRIEELAYMLKLGADASQVVQGKSADILKDWADRIARAKEDLDRLAKELKDPNAGAGKDAHVALGIRKRNLEQIRGILATFAEVLDPDGKQRSEIDVELENIRQTLANGAKQGPGRGGGARGLGGG